MSQAAAALPRAGDVVAGKYLLERLLGQGGMGVVFAAHHQQLGRKVAIKIMLADPTQPEAAQRFVNEARAAANIQNDHVVHVFDIGEENGYAFMVLELLQGEDLAQVLERQPGGRLSPEAAAGYVVQALNGVIEAHALGIVHRDLKPSNLFLARRKDGAAIVKVLDFGISKAKSESPLSASPSALTSTKAMLGSPLYMSPEQLRSSKSVDHRADIWAVGVILYELISGTVPFIGENLGEVFAAILESDPAPLASRVPGVPAGLEAVVRRCLDRRPENRFQTASELAEALLPFAGPSFVAPPSSARYVSSPSLSASSPFAVSTGDQAPPRPGAPSNPEIVVGPGVLTGPGAITGPGAVTGGSARAVGGTMALGAATPPALQRTDNGGWTGTAGTGAGPAAKPRKIALVVVAGMLVAGGGLVAGGVAVVKHVAGASGAASASSSAPGSDSAASGLSATPLEASATPPPAPSPTTSLMPLEPEPPTSPEPTASPVASEAPAPTADQPARTAPTQPTQTKPPPRRPKTTGSSPNIQLTR